MSLPNSRDHGHIPAGERDIMGNSILKSFATAAAVGLALGFVQANARSLPLGGGSALFADTGSEETTRERATSALENMMDRFIRVEDEQTAAAAPADAEGECPEEKKETQIAESKEDKKGDKDSPQGPEPIYFAF